MENTADITDKFIFEFVNNLVWYRLPQKALRKVMSGTRALAFALNQHILLMKLIRTFLHMSKESLNFILKFLHRFKFVCINPSLQGPQRKYFQGVTWLVGSSDHHYERGASIRPGNFPWSKTTVLWKEWQAMPSCSDHMQWKSDHQKLLFILR